MTQNEDSKQCDQSRFKSRADGFTTTHWSLVLQAACESSDSEQALDELCRAYWLPLYAYARRRVRDPHQAQDLTQAFITKLLEKQWLRRADPTRGRFRAFLLTAFKRFITNEWEKETAQKRGGRDAPISLDFAEGERQYRRTPADSLTPDQAFLRDWVRVLLERVFEKLQSEFESTGKTKEFAELRDFITPRQDEIAISEISERLKMTKGAVRVAAHRLRKRYRIALRDEIAKTVSDVDDIEDEIRDLFTAFHE